MILHSLYGRVVAATTPLPAPRLSSPAIPDITITTESVSVNPEIGTTTPTDGFRYQRLGDRSVFVQWYDRFEFRVSSDGSSIRAHRRDGSSDESLFAYLLGHALSIALLQRGVEAMHGAAFEFNGQAVAIVGDCGYGKSTLAAHAVHRGARLLTDDLLVCDGGMVLPGPARIKLDPAIAAVTLGTRTGAPMDDERGKYIYELNQEEFSAEPLPLARVYTLKPHAEEIRIERLSQTEAFHTMVSATFDPLEQSAARLASHMRYHAALVQLIPVFRLHVPRRLAEIDKVLEAI